MPEEIQIAVEEPTPPVASKVEIEEPEEAVIEDKPVEGIILKIHENSWVEIRDKKARPCFRVSLRQAINIMYLTARI